MIIRSENPSLQSSEDPEFFHPKPYETPEYSKKKGHITILNHDTPSSKNSKAQSDF